MRRQHGTVVDGSLKIEAYPFCPHCKRFDHDNDARFCGSCGSALELWRVRVVACSCDETVKLSDATHASNKYCGHCGVSASQLLAEHDSAEAAAAARPQA